MDKVLISNLFYSQVRLTLKGMHKLKNFLKKALKRMLINFWRLHKILVLKNNKYRNLHAGETCFIFANGASLKYYDISNLPRYPVIACSYTLIDKRMQNLNVKYIASTDSYIFYPFLYNTYPFVRKFQKNKIRRIFADIIAKNPHVQFFVNVTNFYSPICRNKNISYFHHFGDKVSKSQDLAGNFAVSDGALEIMLGMAKYFGFSKAILIGCDYLGSPPMMGHFYADYKPFLGTYLSEYCARVRRASEGIDVLVILPQGISSPDFKFASYEEYFGIKKKYSENYELVDMKYIEYLRDAADSYQAIMKQGQ